MSRQGKQCVNHSKGKNSHILIVDKDGKLGKPTKVTAITDDKAHVWEFDQLDSTEGDKRLRLRVRRKDGPARFRTDGELGTLTVSLTDATGATDAIDLDVTFVDDPTAPC